MLERIVNGRTDLVFDWIARGNAARSSDERGVSLLSWCAYYGDVSAMRFLIANGESLASLSDSSLCDAAFHGHWQLCEFLIENGADVNQTVSATGETALHSALCTSDRTVYDLVLRVLLSRGADPQSPLRSWRRNRRVHARQQNERGDATPPCGGVRNRGDDPTPPDRRSRRHSERHERRLPPLLGELV